MAAVPDDKLMPYADGMLDAAGRADVEAMLAKDPASRERLKMFLATTPAEIGKKTAPILEERVPQFLIDTVLATAPASAAAARSARREERAGPAGTIAIASFLSRLLPTWPAAAAYAASIAVAAGAGYALAPRAPTPASGPAVAVAPPALAPAVQIADGRLMAGGVLQRTLESVPSRIATSAAGGEQAATALVQLSYRGPAGNVCRQYDLTLAGGSAFSGIGCRTAEGAWQLNSHVSVQRTAGIDRPKAGVASTFTAPEVASIVEKTAQAMSEDEEKAALAAKWQVQPH